MFEKQIGIDLGTVNVLVYVRGKGIVLQEPSVVAISVRDNRIVAVGKDAAEMIGRVPESIEVARPVRDGVIADYVVTETMLRHFIRRVVGRNPLLRPQIMMSTPKGVTSVERRAVYDAAIQAGAKEAYLIPEPLAAALGAGLPIHTPTGNMVVDIGGGTSEAAVVSMYDIVVWSSVRVGGIRIDQAIINYIRKKYNLIIGEQTAEEIKIQIGSALPLQDPLSLEVRGRDQVAGLPKTIIVTSDEITEAIGEPLNAIVGAVRQTLEKTPPELAADIIDRGIVLTGGGAQLRNVDQLLIRETGVPCFVAENPIACVAIGAGRALENLEVMRRFLPPI
ncbi:MAG: rod shape-determining protein [Anaerolineae bacterium]|nr:rod shape-determining protein [Caldilineales bacterium]MDW8268752.1 rod shape-determining protein [Anaerolineae bacterium]